MLAPQTDHWHCLNHSQSYLILTYHAQVQNISLLTTKQEANLTSHISAKQHLNHVVGRWLCTKPADHQRESVQSVLLYIPHQVPPTTQICKILHQECLLCVHSLQPRTSDPLPNRLALPTQKFLSCHSETRSQTSKLLKLIMSAYPERVLMRILPLKTDLRNQHYFFGCQIFPLEILTSMSYQRKRYENTRLFSKNPDRPHSRLLPSSLVRLSWNTVKLLSWAQENTNAFSWMLLKVLGCFHVCETGISLVKFGYRPPSSKTDEKKAYIFSH